MDERIYRQTTGGMGRIDSKPVSDCESYDPLRNCSLGAGWMLGPSLLSQPRRKQRGSKRKQKLASHSTISNVDTSKHILE
jgi:hypothetical protein